MKEHINILSQEDIETLKQDFEILTFPNDFDVVYENQIPCAGIALLEGEIEITKDSKVHQTIRAGHLLGVIQLLEQKPVRFGCRVKAKSKIIMMGKSDILAFTQHKKNNAHPIKRLLKTS